MTPKEQTAFRIDPETMEALRAIRERDGVGISEQVRRALKAWIATKGVTKPDRRRVEIRRRV